jgi:hypothetical protein
MKTVKTAFGLRTIQSSSDQYLLAVQLHSILKDHRNYLIDKLISNELSRYISYKFDKKASAALFNQIKNNLENLKETEINMPKYDSLLQSVLQNDFTQLGSALFFVEIDKVIKQSFRQVEIFPTERRERLSTGK